MARENSPFKASARLPSALRACTSTRRAAAKSRLRFVAGLTAFTLTEAIHVPSFYAETAACPSTAMPANANFMPSLNHGPGAFKFSMTNAAILARARPSMSEYVDVLPAREIKLGAGRQKLEASFGEQGATFAHQHSVQYLFQAVEVGDVVGRVG